MTLLVGARLGPYQILGHLGSGGMGEVYRASDARIGRHVAVKVLPPAYAADADRLARFEKEAQAAGRLNHANLLAVFDVGIHEGAPYLVTELLEGQTLRERQGGAALPVRKSVELAIQMAHGLAAAHDKGIVHRDLKPENVFVTKDGRLKILDFGLAKLLPPAVGGQIPRDAPTVTVDTDPGTVMGTVNYMSPEQVRGHAVDHRTDIFSLGVILYEMLSGTRAFRRDSAVETMNAILKEEPPELSSVNPAVPTTLDRLVRHCLEKSPEARFQSARDLAFDLEALTGPPGLGATSRPAARSRARTIGLVAGLVALLIGVLGMTYWLTRSTGRAASPRYHQLTFRRGTIHSARFDHLGPTLFYGASWDGQPVRLFSTRVDAGESRIAGIDEANILSISPSGELTLSLGCRFIGGWKTNGELAPRVVPGGKKPHVELSDVQEADWAPDGKQLAVVRRVGKRQRLELFPSQKVLAESEDHWFGNPRFSPRGDLVAFVDHPNIEGDDGSVAIVGLVSPKPTKLGPPWVSIQGLAWSADGAEIWFTASDSGPNMALHAITPAGKERKEPVLRAPGRLRLHDIHPDGRVLLSRETLRSAALGLGPGRTQEHDLSYLDQSFVDGLTGDGKQILLNEQGGNNMSFGDDKRVLSQEWVCTYYLRTAEGAEEIGRWPRASLSEDGTWVIATQRGPPQSLIVRPSLATGKELPLEVGPIRQYILCKWMRDRKSVLFSAREKGPAVRLYVQSISGGMPRAVTFEEAHVDPEHFAIAPDGGTVAAVDRLNHKVVLHPITGGAARVLTGLTDNDLPVQWTDDGRHLYVHQRIGPRLVIERYSLADRRKTLLKKIEPADPAGQLDVNHLHVTPDGKFYAYTLFRLLSDLYVVEGLK